MLPLSGPQIKFNHFKVNKHNLSMHKSESKMHAIKNCEQKMHTHHQKKILIKYYWLLKAN